MNELEPLDGRKVVLVFTDGEDTASRKDAGDVIDRARANEIMVYSIGMENEYFNGQSRVRTSPDRGLRRVSDETGGGFFMLKKQDELGPTFTRVAQELHSQYVWVSAPRSTTARSTSSKCKIKQPGMTARARRSYVAGAPSTQGGKPR